MAAPPVEIRPETGDDFRAIDAVVRTAFGGSGVEVELVHAIRAAPASYVPQLALVAVRGRDVVGHVMVSHAAVESEDGATEPVATLSPLAVAPDHQRQGIGSLLVQEVLRRAGELGEPLVVLEGSPGYYGRLGFEPAERYGIEIDLPEWAPPEAAQAIPLESYDGGPRGRLRFDPLEAIDRRD